MTKSQLLNHDLTHDHAGNGFAVVEYIDEEWVRVTNKYLPERGANRGYLAWVKKLSITMRKKDPKNDAEVPSPVKLTEQDLERLAVIRNDVMSGRKRYEGTHLVAA